jgi:hypothetical protein
VLYSVLLGSVDFSFTHHQTAPSPPLHTTCRTALSFSWVSCNVNTCLTDRVAHDRGTTSDHSLDAITVWSVAIIMWEHVYFFFIFFTNVFVYDYIVNNKYFQKLSLNTLYFHVQWFLGNVGWLFGLRYKAAFILSVAFQLSLLSMLIVIFTCRLFHLPLTKQHSMPSSIWTSHYIAYMQGS